MPDPINKTLEGTDAERVDEALQAITEGNLGVAKNLLGAVIQNTPTHYSHQTETSDGGLDIRFWDQQEFIHFVTWKEPEVAINWIGCAYPRAFFYLGFIAVKEGDYPAAIDFLDRGAALEPTNPKFAFEKALALVRLGQHQAALDLYDQTSAVGPFVSGHDVAVALRGRGFVLIELGRLADADAAFKASLKIEPDSQIARHELDYIAHLRSGGTTTGFGSVATTDRSLDTCANCGAKLESGTAVNLDGIVVIICQRCRTKLTKKWWQFWK